MASYAQFADPPVYRGCGVTGCQRQHYAHGMCNPHYQQAYRATHRERYRAHQRQAQQRYLAAPEHAAKHRARRMFRDAIRTGKIIPPDRCDWCHAEGPVQGHHGDYAKPFAVEWLCRPCHGLHHLVQRLRAATLNPRKRRPRAFARSAQVRDAVYAWFAANRDDVT